MNVTVRTVGIVSTGDMGHAVGRVLRGSGMRVITCGAGRSERTSRLAAAAGIESLASLAQVISESDLFLSLVPPSSARELADRVATAMEATGAKPIFADCNSIGPGTVAAVADVISGVGAKFVDVSIIGPPPKVGQTLGEGTSRFYASGPGAHDFNSLRDHGIDVRVLEGGIGAASGLKMCYAAVFKGMIAVWTQLLVAGELMNLQGPLMAELKAAQPLLLEMMQRQLPLMPPKAYRWVGEMEEIARTFGQVGLTEEIFMGASKLFAFVGATRLGHEFPEDRKLGTSLAEVVDVLAEVLKVPAPAPSGGEM